MQANGPANQRPSLVQRVLFSVARSSPSRALALSKLIPEAQRERVQVGGLYGELARRDPQAAISAAQSIAADDTRGLAFASIAHAWAETDPAAALEWAGKMPLGQVGAEAIKQGIENWIVDAPEAAVTWLTANKDIPNRDDLIRTSFGRWVRIDTDAARRSALSMTGADKFTAIRSVAPMVAANDAPGAMELLRELPPAMQEEAGRNIIQNLASSDPKAAADLLQTFPPKIGDDSALNTIVNYWGKSDPAAAAAWLLGMPPDRLAPMALRTSPCDGLRRIRPRRRSGTLPIRWTTGTAVSAATSSCSGCKKIRTPRFRGRTG